MRSLGVKTIVAIVAVVAIMAVVEQKSINAHVAVLIVEKSVSSSVTNGTIKVGRLTKICISTLKRVKLNH